MSPKGTVEQSVNGTSKKAKETSGPNAVSLPSAQSSSTSAADASPSTQDIPVAANGQPVDQTTRCEETGETSFCEDQLLHTQQLRKDTSAIGDNSEDEEWKNLKSEDNVKHTLSQEINETGEIKHRGVEKVADIGEGSASSPPAESTSTSRAKNKNSKKGSTKEPQSTPSTSQVIGELPPLPCTETCQGEEQEESRLDGTGESTFSDEEDDDGDIYCKPNGASPVMSHDHSSEGESPAPRLRRRCSISDNDNDEEEDDEDYDDDDYYFDERSTHSHDDEKEITDSTKDCDSCGPPIASKPHEVNEGSKNGDFQVTDDKTAENNEKSVEKSRVVTPAADENKKDPSYVPRVGAFYLHDLREEVDEAETSSKAQSSANYCRRPGMLAARWGHDLYVEKYQNPRTTEDIIRRYGYDIRKHDLKNSPVESAVENQPANEGKPPDSGTFSHSRRGRRSFTQSHRDEISPQEDFPPLQDSEARYSSSRRRDHGRQGRRRLGNSNVGDNQPDGHNLLPSERQVLIDRKGRAGPSYSEAPVDGQDRKGRGGTLQTNRRNQRQQFVVRRGRGAVAMHSGRKHDGRDEERVVRKGRGPDGPPNPNSDRQAGDIRRVQFSTNRGGTNEGVNRGVNHRRSVEESEHLPSLQRHFQAPQAGKRYSANRQPSQQQQQPVIGTPGPPDAATLEYCRSVDPSLVAALLQQKQQNPEAFAAVQAGMMPPAYGRRLPMGAYPDQGRYHGDLRPIRGSGGGVPAYEQQPKPLDTGSSQRGF